MAEPDSSDATERENTGEDYSQTQELRDARHLNAGTQDVGNVPTMPSSGSPASVEEPPCAREDGETIRRRFISEGRWRDISPVRDRMMVEAKKAIPDKDARRAWVYGELDRMYPPLEIPIRIGNSAQPAEDTEAGSGGIPIRIGNSGAADSDTYRKVGDDSGSITGLADLPGDWPKLPANASLGAELGWVQANRLRIVEERPGRATLVRLDRAESPAPSLAALGWLETSIRSYAKYVDVAAKASGADDEGESAVMRRERRSVEEVKALIQEMALSEGACPHCGRSG